MNREDLINAILSIRPAILKKDVLDTLNDDELLLIYNNNRFFSNYQNIMRQQKLSVIHYVYEEKYASAELLALPTEEFDLLYLSAIKMNQVEFDKMVADGLAEFRGRAVEECNDAYLAFSLEEQIIASNVLIPANLLTEEEFITQSILLRIHEITEEIKALKADNENNERLMDETTNYMERSELQSDISSNNIRIWKLEQELKSIMNPNDDVTKKR